MRSRSRDELQRTVSKAFKALVDAVEISKAAKEEHFALEYDQFYPGTRTGLLWLKRRSKAAGLAYLRFESALTERVTEGLGARKNSTMCPEDRAKAAREVLSLYLWWTEERARRPDPIEASGLNALLLRAQAQERGVSSDECIHGSDPAEIHEPTAAEQEPLCNQCLMDLALAEQRAAELLYHYELEDQRALSVLKQVPLEYLNT